MSTARLYAPSLTLLAWAGVLSLGVRGIGLTIAALVVLALAAVVSEVERHDRRARCHRR
jgi:hypothetical protein